MARLPGFDSTRPPIAATSARTTAVREAFDAEARGLDQRRGPSEYYHARTQRLIRERIPPGLRVLEVGCGPGDLLAALEPSEGVGVDISPGMVDLARRRHPKLRFEVADAHSFAVDGLFDVIVCHDLLAHLDDVLVTLERLRDVATENTRLVITSYNFVWAPVLRLAQRLGRRAAVPDENWLSQHDICNLLALAGFSPTAGGLDLLLPIDVRYLSRLANDGLVRLPGARKLCLVQWQEAVAAPRAKRDETSVTVVVPCRNEAENIEECIRRIPRMGTHTEIIVVDGASTDGTHEIVQGLIDDPELTLDVRLIDQISGFDYARRSKQGTSTREGMLRMGKGDAVRKGFAQARGVVLMILDADMTVAPEDLPKFYTPLRDGRADFVNGVRLVYPVEREAFRPLNLLGNKVFSAIFSWLLERPTKDTLCGTKALRRWDCERIAANRARFGNFDPFGDFDLLFGAAHLGLRMVDMPVRYHRRVADHTKVSVLRHGPLLGGMVLVGVRRLKWPRWRARMGRLWGRGTRS